MKLFYLNALCVLTLTAALAAGCGGDDQSARQADAGSNPDAGSDHGDSPLAPDAASDVAADREAASQETGGDLAARDSVDGGCTGWQSLLRLSPAGLVDLMTQIDPIVIDVHVPYYGDIPGTDTSIPYTDIDAIEAFAHQDRCADIVLVCEGGGMSQSAGNELVKRGYLRVRDLAGGMLAWEKAGYPLLKDGGI